MEDYRGDKTKKFISKDFDISEKYDSKNDFRSK